MFKAKILTSGSHQDLEKDINTFLDELTNAEVLHVKYQIYVDNGNKHFSSLIIYQISNEGTKFGSA